MTVYKEPGCPKVFINTSYQMYRSIWKTMLWLTGSLRQNFSSQILLCKMCRIPWWLKGKLLWIYDKSNKSDKWILYFYQVPSLCEDLLSSVDQPLKIARDKQLGKDYLLCDYNRDGDSYRYSPTLLLFIYYLTWTGNSSELFLFQFVHRLWLWMYVHG